MIVPSEVHQKRLFEWVEKPMLSLMEQDINTNLSKLTIII